MQVIIIMMREMYIYIYIYIIYCIYITIRLDWVTWFQHYIQDRTGFQHYIQDSHCKNHCLPTLYYTASVTFRRWTEESNISRIPSYGRLRIRSTANGFCKDIKHSLNCTTFRYFAVWSSLRLCNICIWIFIYLLYTVWIFIN